MKKLLLLFFALICFSSVGAQTAQRLDTCGCNRLFELRADSISTGKKLDTLWKAKYPGDAIPSMHYILSQCMWFFKQQGTGESDGSQQWETGTWLALEGAVDADDKLVVPDVVTCNPQYGARPMPAFTSTSGHCTDTPVLFSNNSSIGPGYTIAGYKWYFGDGGTSTNANPTHSYTNGGAYTVWLVAINNKGYRDSVSKGVNVQPKPDATFTYKSSGKTIIFKSTSTDISADYVWDFGDGATHNGYTDSLIHIYADTGTYIVKLVVKNKLGCSSSVSFNLLVGKSGVREFESGTVPIILYPNPFKDGFNLEYTLVTKTDVRITMHDISGRQIAIHHDANNSPGRHTISIFSDNRELQSGVYLLRMNIGDQVYYLKAVKL